MEALAVHELEDDVFFADLSKQISLLIMDDDDDVNNLVSHSSAVSLQGFSQSNYYPATQAAGLPFSHDQQACRRESKGTGVFIPTSLISQPRRKNKQGKTNNNNTQNSSSNNSKLHKNQQEKSRGMMLAHHYQHHHHHHASYSHKPSYELPKELY